MYVCIHVYMYAYIYTCIHTHTHIYIRMLGVYGPLQPASRAVITFEHGLASLKFGPSVHVVRVRFTLRGGNVVPRKGVGLRETRQHSRTCIQFTHTHTYLHMHVHICGLSVVLSCQAAYACVCNSHTHTHTFVFGGFAFPPVSLGPAGGCPCKD